MSGGAQVQAADHDDRAARCEPAFSVISRLGGYSQVALYIRRYGVNQARAMNRSSVYRWGTPADQGGTGGYIPAKHWPALIKAAREHHGIELTVVDFSPHLAAALDAVT